LLPVEALGRTRGCSRVLIGVRIKYHELAIKLAVAMLASSRDELQATTIELCVGSELPIWAIDIELDYLRLVDLNQFALHRNSVAGIEVKGGIGKGLERRAADVAVLRDVTRVAHPTIRIDLAVDPPAQAQLVGIVEDHFVLVICSSKAVEAAPFGEGVLGRTCTNGIVVGIGRGFVARDASEPFFRWQMISMPREREGAAGGVRKRRNCRRHIPARKNAFRAFRRSKDGAIAVD